ncbi:hypothetical protein Sjap_010710 [Stephania japonica]|uniref:Uncharacterized protein n=1 Tax=Stephania japonica TaxID=461633 RepID=A0AAP0P4E5_9MAGN
MSSTGVEHRDRHQQALIEQDQQQARQICFDKSPISASSPCLPRAPSSAASQAPCVAPSRAPSTTPSRAQSADLS